VLLAKQLAKLIDHGIALLGAPPALGGILIALLVISPKGVSAVKAALANQPQKAMNLGIGSAAPAIGLTIPVILAIGLITGKTLIMGLVPGEMVLLALTLVLSTLTFSGPRTTLLEGAAHLVVFFMYIVLVFAP
jgi:Ca2+:H+ antiporter